MAKSMFSSVTKALGDDELVPVPRADDDDAPSRKRGVAGDLSNDQCTSASSNATMDDTDLAGCQRRLQWLLAEYHGLCLEYQLPPVEITATAVVREKSFEEVMELAIKFVNLARSAIEGVNHKNNPFFSHGDQVQRTAAPTSAAVRVGLESVFPVPSSPATAPAAALPHGCPSVPESSAMHSKPRSTCRSTSGCNRSLSYPPEVIAPEQATETIWTLQKASSATSIGNGGNRAQVAASVNNAAPPEHVGALLRRASLEYSNNWLDATADSVQQEASSGTARRKAVTVQQSSSDDDDDDDHRAITERVRVSIDSEKDSDVRSLESVTATCPSSSKQQGGDSAGVNAAPLITVADEVDDNDERIVQIGDFVIGKLIGRGIHGEVRLAVHCVTRELVAVKLVAKHKHRPSLHHELEIVRRLNHKNIVKARQCIDDPRSRFLYFVMDLAHGPVVDMSKPWKPLPLSLLFRKYFVQAVSALSYLHDEAKIVHRDIKPDNLLLDRNGNLLLCDFGVAKHRCRAAGQKDCAGDGATAYRAPEEFVCGGLSGGSRVDVWSLAVCFYQLSTGVLPFRGDTFSQMRGCIADPLTTPAFDADASDELRADEMWPDWRALLESMLRKEPTLRVSARWLLRDPRVARWSHKIEPQPHSDV